ncbi:MAG: molybdate ABC transporter substrate-binding protein [Proteobacteria bacterium]|nr:molybdate ABC transporter substrate-binding protein [Pseudomonadota bacterium]MBI3496865.1 molybdate ABC transporter substrate-binding protein [Pseudomonadota bacterium]
MRSFVLAGVATLTIAITEPGQAADLVVLSAAAVRSAVAEVPSSFEKATGNHVRFVFGTAGAMRDKVISGEPVDIVIVPPSQLDDLMKRGLVADGSRTDLGVVRLGVAVRSGAKRPSIATAADFKQTLLDAPSLGMADAASGATTGIYFAKLLQQIGIADALKNKLKLYPDGAGAMEAVARGEIVLGAGQISEIMPVKGVDLAGPLPDELQLRTIYTAGLAAKSTSPEAARALLRLLRSAEMAPAFKASGFDPP